MACRKREIDPPTCHPSHSPSLLPCLSQTYLACCFVDSRAIAVVAFVDVLEYQLKIST